jgi:hypothetical protein
VERLEGRLLFALALPDGAGASAASARAVDLRTSTRAAVSEFLDTSTDADVFAVVLRQGEFLVADVDPTLAIYRGVIAGARATVLTAFTSSIRGESVLARSANYSPEPDTGVVTRNAVLGFQAPVTGTYYLRVGTTATEQGHYRLEFRRSGLAEGRQDPAVLRRPGAMSASLVGGVLHLTGPSGYGFGVRGDWRQDVTTIAPVPPLIAQAFAAPGAGAAAVIDPDPIPKNFPTYASTYTATGLMYLQTAAGELTLEVPAGETFTVTTAANAFGQSFGDVTSVAARFGLPLGQYAQMIAPEFGLELDAISLGDKWSVRMGSSIRNDVPQALEGVPYLFYGDTARVVARFGQNTITTGDTDATLFVADPSDPFLYLRSGNFAFAGSRNGRIPFVSSPTTPLPGGLNDPPPPRDFYGHVFARAEFPLTGLPLEVVGEVTVDLDANDDGQLIAGLGNASLLFRGDLFGRAADAVFADINVGVNGRVNLGYRFGQWDLTVPLGIATAVYSGPQQGIWFNGHTGPGENPWAGTSLSFLQYADSSQTTRLAGYVLRNGTYRVTGTNTYRLLGARAEVSLSLANTGVAATASVDVLGSRVSARGEFLASGDFTLLGEAQVNFGPLSGAASVSLSKLGSTRSFTADLHARFSLGRGIYSAKGDATGLVRVSYTAAGAVSYSGQVRLSGGVYVGTKVASISASSIIRSKRVTFVISKIGRVTFALP